MTFDYNLVNKFLDVITPFPEDFGYKSEQIKEMRKKISEIDFQAKLEYGVSKMVIISPSLKNIVIKIPFKGQYLHNQWSDFYWAPSTEDNSDYCLAEYEKYKKLKSLNLDCFVAKTMYYKTIDGVRIFIQEKAISEDDSWLESFRKPSKKSQKIARQFSKERITGDLTVSWVAKCLDAYGEDKVREFLKYCDEVDSDILEDSHSGNYGYRLDKTPVIFDFSNYLDD